MGRFARGRGLVVCACLLLFCSLSACAAADASSLSVLAGTPLLQGDAGTLAQGPGSLAVAPDGTVYESDGLGDETQEILPSGQEQTVVGSFSGGAGTFTAAPRTGDIALDTEGDKFIDDPAAGAMLFVAANACTGGCPFGLPSTTAGAVYTIAGSAAATPQPADIGLVMSDASGAAVDLRGDVLFGGQANGVILIARDDCSSDCPYGLSSMTAGGLYTIVSANSLPTTLALAVDAAGDVAVTGSPGTIELLAAGSCSSGCPFGFSSLTAGDLYVLAGTGQSGYSGDGGPGPDATLAYPVGASFDARGDLAFADEMNNRVRLIAAHDCASDCAAGLPATTAGDIYTVAGTGQAGSTTLPGSAATSASLTSPVSTAFDPHGDLLIGSDGYLRLLAASACDTSCPYGLDATARGDLYAVAGNGAAASGDGAAAIDGRFDRPEDLAADGWGDSFVLDRYSRSIRMVAGFSCDQACPFGLTSMTEGDIYTVAGDASVGAETAVTNGQPATATAIGFTSSLTVDSRGDLVLDGTDSDNQFEVVPAYDCDEDCPFGLTAMTAGHAYLFAFNTDAAFSRGMAIDSNGDLLFADDRTFQVKVIAGTTCDSSCPFGLDTMTAGNVYAIAGRSSSPASEDGRRIEGQPAADAGILPAAVAVDPTGDVIIEETLQLDIVAARSCTDDCPYGLSSMTRGDIYVLAGNNGQGDTGDGGPAFDAKIGSPDSMTLDPAGNLVFTDIDEGDANAESIRMIAASSCAVDCPYGLSSTVEGDIYTLPGDWTPTSAEPVTPITAPSTLGSWAGHLTANPDGQLLVIDQAERRVMAMTGAPTAPQATLELNVSGAGSITAGPVSCATTCTESAAQGTTVTLTAHPEPGSDLASWSGTNCTGTDPCTITLSGAQHVTATFAAATQPPPTQTTTTGTTTQPPPTQTTTTGTTTEPAPTQTATTETTTQPPPTQTTTTSSTPNRPVTTSPSPSTTLTPRSAPAVTGRPIIGRTLTATTGVWPATPPARYAYQWQRCSRTCISIAGATTRSYRPRAIDLRHTIRVIVAVIAANGSGISASPRTRTVRRATRS